MAAADSTTSAVVATGGGRDEEEGGADANGARRAEEAGGPTAAATAAAAAAAVGEDFERHVKEVLLGRPALAGGLVALQCSFRRRRALRTVNYLRKNLRLRNISLDIQQGNQTTNERTNERTNDRTNKKFHSSLASCFRLLLLPLQEV